MVDKDKFYERNNSILDHMSHNSSVEDAVTIAQKYNSITKPCEDNFYEEKMHSSAPRLSSALHNYQTVTPARKDDDGMTRQYATISKTLTSKVPRSGHTSQLLMNDLSNLQPLQRQDGASTRNRGSIADSEESMPARNVESVVSIRTQGSNILQKMGSVSLAPTQTYMGRVGNTLQPLNNQKKYASFDSDNL